MGLALPLNDQQSPGSMTVDAFRQWAARQGGSWELVNGTPRAMVRPGNTHSIIQARAVFLFERHFAEKGSPCRAAVEPAVIPKGFARHNARAPDVVVTCAPPEEDDWALTDPVLIVEILSPGNAGDTRDNVLAFMTIPSLREILLLHSTRMRGELLVRGPAGDWPAEPLLLDADDPFTLASIGLSLHLRDFYSRTKLAQV